MRKRLRKKLHKLELGHRVVDVSQSAFWRRRLFESREHETFLIDRKHLAELPAALVRAVRVHDLRIEVARVGANDAPPWLSESGMIVFRFRAVEFPAVVIYSGNNPDFI